MTRSKLSVLIADDELMARRRLRRIVDGIAGVEVVSECSGGEQALAEIEARRFDVALLDIEMPGVSGLELSRAAAAGGTAVIFVTAHPEHALTAFDNGVVDYVLKPLDAERLELALERVARRRAQPAGEPATALERLALSVRGELRLIDFADVSHALLDGELTSVWVNGEAVLTELTLAELQKRLPAARFERVHRRALLSLEHVERLKPLASGGYLAVTRGGQEVPISRQAARALRRRLGIA